MKALSTSLFALLIASFGVFPVPAGEPSQNRDELRELRSRVQQLQNRIRELEGGAKTVTSKESSPLARAVERFNAHAAKLDIGRTQPPLTVEEVIAAIRWVVSTADSATAEELTSEELAAYRNIADTQRLPPDTDFSVIGRFISNDGYKFQAWSVRLRMPRSGSKGLTYALPIRQRWISSAPLTEPERKALGLGSESGQVHYYHLPAGDVKRSGREQ